MPSFDRSNVDGFAVVAESVRRVRERRAASRLVRRSTLGRAEDSSRSGTAVSIATGGGSRGADAVVMVEHETHGRELRIAKAVTAGSGVSFAGTDITAGDLASWSLLTSRYGVLAAIACWRQLAKARRRHSLNWR